VGFLLQGLYFSIVYHDGSKGKKMDGSVKIKDIFIKMKLHVFIKRMKWKCIILEIILMSISEC
jgi:hypothetical protein